MECDLDEDQGVAGALIVIVCGIEGIPSGADTDPFFGVDEKYRGFLERIGVRIEETTKPVDFLAGTWS